MLDMNNKIAETTACNIFWIKKKTIFTPGISSILNGITRRSIIEICKLKKIDIKIGNYKIKKISIKLIKCLQPVQQQKFKK